MPMRELKNALLFSALRICRTDQHAECEGINLQVVPTASEDVMSPHRRIGPLTTVVMIDQEKGSRSDSLRIWSISKKSKQQIAVYEDHDG